MKNKRGGAGAKIVLVLILMIASAIGGAYGYRVLDGKIAARDALKAVENVDVSDYDTEEQTIIQGYIDEATKDIENAKTRKDVYEVITDFIADVEKVQTKNEKELEKALKEAEEAKEKYKNPPSTYDGSGDTDGSEENGTEDGGSTDNNGSSNSGYDDEDDDDGFLNSLLGGLFNGASGN